MRHFAKHLLDTLLPPQCLVSGDVVQGQGQIQERFWKDIHFIDGAVCTQCGKPFSFDPGPEMKCAVCLKRAPTYDQARAAFVYDDVSRKMVLSFKHGDRMDGVRTYARWMCRAGSDLMKSSGVIVPVPLHKSRLISRRYNQSAILAQAIGKEAERPVVVDLLQRIRRTDSQHGKNHKERKRNVSKAFRLNPKWQSQIQGARVLLVDDVLTTGATVEACAAVLKGAGATNVDVLTLARVVALDRHPI